VVATGVAANTADDVGGMLEPLGLSLFKPDNEVLEDARGGDLKECPAIHAAS